MIADNLSNYARRTLIIVTWLLPIYSLQAAEIPPLQFANIGDLRLLSGEILYDTSVGYRTSGQLNADLSNVIVFPTWFTGTTAGLYSGGLIGPELLADTDKYFVIAIDALGNGVSSSPSNHKEQGGGDFPAISIADMVLAQHILLTKHLGVDHATAVMGESMGGMQVFQWMGQFPEFMDAAIPIDGYPHPTSYDLLQWTTHEAAIVRLQNLGATDKDISDFLARLNLLTLWTPSYFVRTVEPADIDEYIAAEQKRYTRIDAYNYLSQLRAMIHQNAFAKQGNSAESYATGVSAKTLVIGVPSDQMVNPTPAKLLAIDMDAKYVSIDSDCGHMGTTCEAATVAEIVNQFLDEM